MGERSNLRLFKGEGSVQKSIRSITPTPVPTTLHCGVLYVFTKNIFPILPETAISNNPLKRVFKWLHLELHFLIWQNVFLASLHRISLLCNSRSTHLLQVFFLLTQINWWFRGFLVSHHICFNFNKAKTTECMHWRCGGWFYVSSFFYITILLESKNRPLKPPFVLIFAILLISIKPRASEQSLWEIRAKVRKGGTNDHWETKKRKMSSLRNCHRVRRRARLLNSTQYGHHDLNKK